MSCHCWCGMVVMPQPHNDLSYAWRAVDALFKMRMRCRSADHCLLLLLLITYQAWAASSSPSGRHHRQLGARGLSLASRTGQRQLQQQQQQANVATAGSYLGCYTDLQCKEQWHKTAVDSIGSVLSIESCINRVSILGYAYAVLQGGAHCYACNDFSDQLFGPADVNATCDMPCYTNTSTICGGKCGFSIYATGVTPSTTHPVVAPPLTGVQDLGCFINYPCGSLHDRKMDFIAVTGTPEECQQKALALGYVYAAMEHAQVCYASNVSPYVLFGNVTDPSNCSSPCYGNNSQFCGGICRLSMYSLTDVFHYQGCYSDNTCNSPVRKMVKLSKCINVTEDCRILAAKNGSIYYAVQNTNECWVSDQDPVTLFGDPVSDGACRRPCPGNPTATCGGPCFAAIYAVADVQRPTPSDGSSLRSEIIAAAVIIPVAVVALLLAVTLWWRHRKMSRAQSYLIHDSHSTRNEDDCVVMHVRKSDSQSNHVSRDMPSWLTPGDPFGDTARQYSWVDIDPSSIPTRIESGINELPLDAYARDGSSPVMELNPIEVQQQLELVTDGLLGRGGAAMVFMCRWPDRFGPDALLAAKVMTRAYPPSEHIVQAFTYEAELLSSIRHPHVVRLYGYCLSLPTVCLIMELLPGSLEDLLYSNTFNTLCLQPQPSCDSQPSSVAQNTAIVGHLAQVAAAVPTVVGHDAQHSSVAGGALAATVLASLDSISAAVEITPPPTAVSLVATHSAVAITPDPDAASTAPGPARHAEILEACVMAVVQDDNITLTPVQSDGVGSSVADSRQSKSQSITTLTVLRIMTDIAAGLTFLHNRQAGDSKHLVEQHSEGLVLQQSEGEAIMLNPATSSRPARYDSGLAFDMLSPCESEMLPDELSTCEEGSYAKVVHRDLKPANILISSQGRAKISDFGLAREYATTTMHTVHVGAGTLVYQAPELLAVCFGGQNAFNPTNRCDVYSLGIMMWEMLAREKPWKGLSTAQLVTQVCGKKRPPIPLTSPSGRLQPQPVQQATDPSQLPASFESLPQVVDLIRACWRHRDMKRPTAAQVFDRLCQLLDQAQQYRCMPG